MFYAFAKRLTVRRPDRFWPVFAVSCLIGFVLSFAGFRTLVAYVYPALGYLGAVLIAVIAVAWLRARTSIREETGRRHRLLALARDPQTPAGRRQFRQALAASPLEESQLMAALSEELARSGQTGTGADAAEGTGNVAGPGGVAGTTGSAQHGVGDKLR